MAGKTNHPKKINAPAKIRKISVSNPIIIKKTLITAPKIRKIKLEKKTEKYLPISKPFP